MAVDTDPVLSFPSRRDLTYEPLPPAASVVHAETTVDVRIVSAVALEPGKFYVVEADAEKVSVAQMNAIASAFRDMGIKACLLCTTGGTALRIVESEAPRG